MIKQTDADAAAKINLPSAGFVRMEALAKPHGIIPVSRSTLNAWIQAGIFPKPVAIGRVRIKGFRVEDVRAFLANPTPDALRAASSAGTSEHVSPD